MFCDFDSFTCLFNIDSGKPIKVSNYFQVTLKSTVYEFPKWVEILLPNKHFKNCITSESRTLDVPSCQDELNA